MNIGIIILLAITIIVYAGFAHRALDRLRLTDRAALVFLAAMLLGGFLPEIPLGGNVSINIGGGIIPLILVIYLFSKAESWEVGRTLLAVIITTAVVYITIKIMPVHPAYLLFLDPLYLVAIVAGLVAYLAGRSRRSAFIAGVMAIILSDLLALIENILIGVRAATVIGGAGFFDAIVISGFIALGLAEIFGETAERLAPMFGAKTRREREAEGRGEPEGHNEAGSEGENRNE
jgi:hypothetical protein